MRIDPMTITEKQIESAALELFSQLDYLEWDECGPNLQGEYLDLARAVLSAAEYWREPCDHFADVTKMVPADSPVPPAEPVLPLPTQDVYYSEVAGVVTEYARAAHSAAVNAHSQLARRIRQLRTEESSEVAK
jgi:hypothetical protein